VMSSVSQSVGLPALEAAAAGRLVICTPVGNFPQYACEGAGIMAPIEPEKFKEFTARTLRSYKDKPAAFMEKCRAIQKAAKMFDWRYAIDSWVGLIEAAK
jgi:glycosyltransferase involved in cell wall biosynthesis